MIRPQAVVLPILRAALPGVSVVSQLPDVDHRTYAPSEAGGSEAPALLVPFPMVLISREGGTRNPNLPRRHSHPALELSAYSADGLVEAEELYEDALDALYAAVRDQTVVEGVGYLQSIPEAEEATQAPSEVPDTWKATGTVQLSIRAA